MSKSKLENTQYLPSVSIIVPAWNEADNIELLVKRISKSLTPVTSMFEIIVVDDHSNDDTAHIVKTLAKKYPVQLLTKVLSRGKAFSLLQGFKAAKYEVLAMIDADLQYPPEALPEMIDQIKQGTHDVVVANRIYKKVSQRRKFVSQVFRYMFADMLHGLTVDVQSGLKVFRKEIFDRITLNPSQWTFDLEFLLKARAAGYSIGSTSVIFSPRHAGESKVKLLSTMWEIGISAVQQKFKDLEETPFSPEKVAVHGHGFHFKGKEYIHHTQLPSKLSALENLTTRQKIMLTAMASAVILSLIVNWHTTLIIIISALTVIYFIDLIFYVFLIFSSFHKRKEINIEEKDLSTYHGAWPSYTILCPLYKEWHVVPQFIDAMNNLDYPKDKLQVLLLLEEDDSTTIDKITEIDLPAYFETVVVPHSLPKTKPKACNYGLSRATGEFAVIYDAEDIPDPYQLKKAVLAFDHTDSTTVCVQAKLNFYNPEQNILTRIFTAEYSLWFNLVLSGLQGIDAPIPLGGTSNHFKMKDLQKIQGWDSFNVTEDCDLGVRLARQGYRTAIINSITMEEANSEITNWFWQRTRWIKGYIQTYLVHMRHPLAFIQSAKSHHFPIFQLVVGGKVMLALINPIMWILTIAYFMSRTYLGPFIESLFPPIVLYMGVVSLVLGNFMYLYYYMLGTAKLGQFQLIKYTYLVPLYWLLMSIAAWTSVIQLIYKPHHWAKTKHGLHLQPHLKFDMSPALRKVFSRSQIQPTIS